MKTGHLTHVVWRGSTVLGIGRAEITRDGMKCAYIVGRYKPAGNFIGQFQQNVPRGNFQFSYCKTIGKMSFDEQLQRHARIIDSPQSAVDILSTKLKGPAEFQRQDNGLLNSNKEKKSAITKKHS